MTHSIKQKKVSEITAVLLPYFLLAILMTVVIGLKCNFHVDEIFSYGLANHPDDMTISIEEGKVYTPAALPFYEYITVQPGFRFYWSNVWENQAMDVHPPLYYAILHGICSLFPGQFSRYFAGSINIVFALIALYYFRRCVRLFTDDRKILFLMSLVFAVTPGTLAVGSFLRMYAMAMCWDTIVFYIFLEDLGRQKTEPVFYIKLGLAAAAGALTHYYCIVFTVLLSFLYGLRLLVRKQYKKAAALAATGAIAGGVSVLIFHPMIRHIFLSYRAAESIDNLKAPFSEFVLRLHKFCGFVNREMFGSFGVILVAFTLIGWIVFYLRNRRSVEPDKTKRTAFLLLYMTCAVYSLFVSISAVFISDRYLFPIYPLTLIGFLLPLLQLLKSIGAKTAIPVMIMLVITASSYVKYDWYFLYRQSQILHDSYRSLPQADVLCVYKEKWQLYTSFLDIENYHNAVYISADKMDLIADLYPEDLDQLILLVTSDAQDVIPLIRKNYPKLSVMEDKGRLEMITTFYLHAPEKDAGQ